ncbi:MAG TPA: pitrilysin family protein [Verrucomicrobiae bacterium]|nr:pitrilysin family protein [Verrucomicrobiae bacterium]
MAFQYLRRSPAAVSGLLLAGGLMTSAQTLNAPPVHKVILDNGLTLLVREDHSAPVVSAQAWVRAGSITEGKWLGAGLSHVLEHMLFKGTTTRGVAEIAKEVEDKGGYINAFTSFEQTVFYINMPSENWGTAVDILADCMQHATIPEAELLKEKKVILREMAMNNDDPDRRAQRILWATAYTTHPYRFPVIGYPDIYNRVTRDDVVAYYKEHYLPNNIVFVVGGDVNAQQVEQKLRELTKDFKKGAIEPAFVPPEPPQLSLRERDEEMSTQLSEIDLAWHIPSITSPDVYPLDVLSIVLGQGKSSRLYVELLQKRGLVHSIDTSSYTPDYPGIFVIDAKTDPDKREAAIAAIREQVKALAENPVSDAELHKAINISISSYLDRLKTMQGQANDIAQNEFLVHDPDFSKTYLENLKKVTQADLQRVIQRYFTDNNLTITSLNPTGTLGKEKEAAAVRTEIQIQKFEFPNGLRLLVREDPKLPLVDFRAVMKGGVLAETAADNGITRMTARMLLKGTKTRTAEQIAETMESGGGDISYFAGNNSFGVSAESLSENFDRTLDLLADVLQNPTFPQDMLARERDVQISEYKAEQDQIIRQGQQLLREALYREHPYRLNALGTPESLARITSTDLANFQRRFIVPNNIVLTVFGNVKADEVRRKVEARFGEMKSVKLEFPRIGPERLKTDVNKVENVPKEQAVLLIGYSGTDIFNKDRYPLELLDEAYSGQGSPLFLRIRDELGLCYYVGAYELVGLDPGYFVFYVGTTPQNVGTCEKEILAELDKLKTNGLSDKELSRAKSSLLGQRRVQMQDNSQLSMMVGLDELYGLGYDFFKTAEDRYRAVTVDDVKRVARSYFDGKPHAMVVVEPAAK